MAGKDDETEEPSSNASPKEDSSTLQPKGRRLSFNKVRRDLSDEELGSPGVQKMLLDELDRLEGIEKELKSVVIKYNDVRIDLGIVREKLKTHNAFDVISTGTVSAGSLIFGAAFSLEKGSNLGAILAVIGIVLVAIGISAKVMRS